MKKAANCPGKSHFLKDAKDIAPGAFRRIVRRRAGRILEEDVGLVATEDERRQLEASISAHFEKVNLEPNFLPASFLSDGSDRARAVCRISTPTSLGTGFLIAPGIIMTNNHVLSSSTIASASMAEFGFEDGMNPTLASIQPDRLFLTDAALDFTIVACDPTPLDGILPVPLLRDPASATRHDRVNVIQHPRGRRKEVALHDNRVERVLDRVLRYRTDTEPGSSGSPVFNNEWDLVALHHAGEAEPDGTALNEGIRISAIVNHILGRNSEALSQNEALREAVGAMARAGSGVGFFDAALPASDFQEVEVRDFSGTPMFADVGVWNIEHFRDDVAEQRVDDVAEVVARLSLDVLGLVEVQQGAMERLQARLATLGHTTAFKLLNVPGSQDLAVLFDQDTTEVELRSDLIDRHRDRLTKRTDSGKTAFPRFPLFAKCKVRDDEDNEVEFILMVVHLKAFGDAESRARRRLAARLLSEIIEDVRRSEGIPVILGGDFNDTLDNDVLSPLSGAPDLFALTADDAGTDAISFVGSSHRSLIDHVIVSRDVQLGEISGDDAAIVRLDQSVRDFSDRVSDHVPIVFRMVIRTRVTGDEAPVTDDTGVIHIPLPDGAEGVRLQFQ